MVFIFLSLGWSGWERPSKKTQQAHEWGNLQRIRKWKVSHLSEKGPNAHTRTPSVIMWSSQIVYSLYSNPSLSVWDSDETRGRKQKEADEDEEIEETPQEKKLRLAKLYLEQLREEGGWSCDQAPGATCDLGQWVLASLYKQGKYLKNKSLAALSFPNHPGIFGYDLAFRMGQVYDTKSHIWCFTSKTPEHFCNIMIGIN